MFKVSLKYKFLIILWLVSTLIGSVMLLVPSTASANHDQCYGLSTLLNDIQQCTAQKRDAANRACYTSNEGNNTAIADCVKVVTAHYTFTGSPADAPALPGSSDVSSTPTKVPGITVGDKDCKESELNGDNCKIVQYLNDFISVLSVIVGIVVTIMIVVGGIQYTAAGGDPNTVAKAKKQIFNAIFALVAYGLIFAILQYLIPGGLLQ